jgi:hypothetical protein
MSLELKEGVVYVVTFVCYRYNDGSANNGNYLYKERFTDLDKAREFKRRLECLLEGYPMSYYTGPGLSVLNDLLGTKRYYDDGFIRTDYRAVRLYAQVTEEITDVG